MNEASKNTIGMQTGGVMKINKKKPTIFIKEVENGYLINFDNDGYAYNEQTFVAYTKEDVLAILTNKFKETTSA